ncbi:MAG: hypothetical protein Q7J84_08390 [Sulfuricaulis sp.]|nr:hypothetical protein [Sulfuricaulis sp.]
MFATVSKFAEPGSAQFIGMALTLTFPAGESFLHTWQDIFHQVHEINPYITVIAAVTPVADQPDAA